MKIKFVPLSVGHNWMRGNQNNCMDYVCMHLGTYTEMAKNEPIQLANCMRLWKKHEWSQSATCIWHGEHLNGARVLTLSPLLKLAMSSMSRNTKNTGRKLTTTPKWPLQVAFLSNGQVVLCHSCYAAVQCVYLILLPALARRL